MYNHISIFGGSGSGKSTLCNILSSILNIPAIHLNSFNYLPNWTKVDTEKWDSIILKKLDSPQWIIDGNYNNTLRTRLEKSDLIIWLDYSTIALLKGVLKRYIHLRHKELPEIPGCTEKLSLNFLKFVAGYRKNKRPIIKENLQEIDNAKILIFKKQKDLNSWLKSFSGDDNILDKFI